MEASEASSKPRRTLFGRHASQRWTQGGAHEQGFFRHMTGRTRMETDDETSESATAPAAWPRRFPHHIVLMLGGITAGLLLAASALGLLQRPHVARGMEAEAQLAAENVSLRALNADLHKRLAMLSRERDVLFEKASAYQHRMEHLLASVQTDGPVTHPRHMTVQVPAAFTIPAGLPDPAPVAIEEPPSSPASNAVQVALAREEARHITQPVAPDPPYVW